MTNGREMLVEHSINLKYCFWKHFIESKIYSYLCERG